MEVDGESECEVWEVGKCDQIILYKIFKELIKMRKTRKELE